MLQVFLPQFKNNSQTYIITETEQDPMVLVPTPPNPRPMSSACLICGDFSQRICLIREMRTCKTNSQKQKNCQRPNNNKVVISVQSLSRVQLFATP